MLAASLANSVVRFKRHETDCAKDSLVQDATETPYLRTDQMSSIVGVGLPEPDA